MKQMDELQIDAKTMGYSGAAVGQTIEVGGRSAEGFTATAGLFDPASNDPKMEQFVKSYQAQDPDTPREALTFYHATLYDGVKMLAQAMEHVAENGGDPDNPSEVRQAFFDIGTFEDVVTGEATYEEGNTVPKKPFQVLEVKDGAFVPIGSITC
jgi:branched-chain amino acid transport system substrate-binding protein